MNIQHSVIIVGGGMAGLTAAAYLSKLNRDVLLIEKEPSVGGLLGSFVHQGYTFDKGARSIEDSGIIFAMLKDLGITIDWVKSPITMQVGEHSLVMNEFKDIESYHQLLNSLFPNEIDSIQKIMDDIYRVMGYMDVLYGIENPLFMTMPPKMDYLTKELLPWLFRLIPSLKHVKHYMEPVQKHLLKYTSNQQLIDLIAQHFFEETPAFFALSYFTIYLDYYYPKGGTGVLPEAMKAFIESHGGTLALETSIVSIQPEDRLLVDNHGNTYHYDELIWAADTKLLYRLIDTSQLRKRSLATIVTKQRLKLLPLKGADSVLSLYLGVNLPLASFKSKIGPHGFITPSLVGQATHPLTLIKDNTGHYVSSWSAISDWITRYLEVTTFEVAIPGLRDENLVPVGHTGLIISVLFDYQLTKHIVERGWYGDLKTLVENKILAIFESLWLLQLVKHKTLSQVATPLTIERYTNNSEGSLSGWSFSNRPFPVVTEFMKVTSSVKTPLPHVTQCGQWTFNPAGIPVAVMTGKLAVDRIIKKVTLRK